MLFSSCFSLEKGAHSQNWHVLYCRIKLTFLLTVCEFGWCSSGFVWCANCMWCSVILCVMWSGVLCVMWCGASYCVVWCPVLCVLWYLVQCDPACHVLCVMWCLVLWDLVCLVLFLMWYSVLCDLACLVLCVMWYLVPCDLACLVLCVWCCTVLVLGCTCTASAAPNASEQEKWYDVGHNYNNYSQSPSSLYFSSVAFRSGGWRRFWRPCAFLPETHGDVVIGLGPTEWAWSAKKVCLTYDAKLTCTGKSEQQKLIVESKLKADSVLTVQCYC